MEYQHIEVEPLTPTIGATIHGVDLSRPLNDRAFDEIHHAWMEHLVVFFRDQELTPEQHLEFGRRFGPLHIHPAAPYVHDNPELMHIHTDRHSHRNNGAGWHSDVSADEEPPLGSILHLHKVPPRGGDTLFASMYAAYDALSAPMQNWLEGLKAIHRADYSGLYGNHTPQRASPQSTHPVIRTHPVTGEKTLYVNSGFTRRIDGLNADESHRLLQFLFEHIQNSAFQCRFQWQQNSIAMWDNRCTQHLAIWDYFPETRSGIRVTVKGDRPFC